jgi:hypothetical protein
LLLPESTSIRGIFSAKISVQDKCASTTACCDNGIRDDIYTNWIAQGVDFLSNTFPAKHIDFNCVLLNNLFNFKDTDLHFFPDDRYAQKQQEHVKKNKFKIFTF